jgi:hypothetical protein
VGLSWYHTDAQAFREDQSKAEWFEMGAYSVDADAANPHFLVAQADPRPVFKGPGMFVEGTGSAKVLNRNGNFLADFTNSEFTPDGRLALAYSRSDVNQNSFAQPQFVQSDVSLGLSPQKYWNGPR